MEINNMPKNTYEEFKEFSDMEFIGNKEFCFKYVWDNFKVWKIFFENSNMKLDLIIDKLNNINTEEKPEIKEIKLLSGRKLKREA